MTEKESYGIRVRFRVDGKGRLRPEHKQPDPPNGNRTVAAELLPEDALLATHPGGPFSEAEELVIRCNGFESSRDGDRCTSFAIACAVLGNQPLPMAPVRSVIASTTLAIPFSYRAVQRTGDLDGPRERLEGPVSVPDPYEARNPRRTPYATGTPCR